MGKAPQTCGEAAGKISTGHVSWWGGFAEIRAPKPRGQRGNQISLLPQLSELGLHRNSLPRAVAESQSLEVFKSPIEEVLRDMV